MEHQIRKAGAFAAFFEGFAYITGIIIFFSLLMPDVGGSPTDTESLAFLLERKSLFQLTNLLIYPLFGIALVFLSLALYERMQHKDRFRAQAMAGFGLVWAVLVIASGMIANVGIDQVAGVYTRDPEQAGRLWIGMMTISEALGGGVEIVGAVWVLLISLSGFRRGTFPKGFNILGLLVALPGMLTLFPGMGELGALFGLLQIPWFIWLGFLFLRTPHRTLNLDYVSGYLFFTS